MQDYGVVDAGETIACTAVFDSKNAETIRQYWITRTLVEVIDTNGASIGKRRVVVKSWTRVDRFADKLTVTLEFWAV